MIDPVCTYIMLGRDDCECRDCPLCMPEDDGEEEEKKVSEESTVEFHDSKPDRREATGGERICPLELVVSV